MAAYFAVCLFSSAFLLFLVQPMFAKLVLPLLGGTPMVWNTCMLFYQAVLLGGYLYAHLAVTRLGERRQAVLHLVLLTASLAWLPIGLAPGLVPPAEGQPALWLIGVLAASVGVPFFFVSSTAPMLQKWFAATGAAGAKDPYFLYAASNLGSMLALLGYPALVEPYLGLAAQTRLWSAGYGVLALLCVGAALALRRSARTLAQVPAPAEPFPQAAAPISWSRRLRWLLLSLCPSSLLLGLTNYLTTDIAAVPLLWVLPLALYLLTFILVFSRKTIFPHAWAVRAQPFAVLVLAVLFPFSSTFIWVMPLHLLAFFLTAMVCHGELAGDRPEPAFLTEYYLIMSVGGALGGLINALAAPALLSTLAEYPLALALGCLLRPAPGVPGAKRTRILDYALPALIAALAVGVIALLKSLGDDSLYWRTGLLAASALVLLGFSERPMRLGLSLAAVLMTLVWIPFGDAVILHQSRNFFGTLTVKAEAEPGGDRFAKLLHGYTVHGVQNAAPELACEPLSYYHRKGPLGRLIEANSGRNQDWNVAAVGLGAGAAAAYAQPGWSLTFFEINPEVERLARDDRYFTYLRSCAPQARVVLGDARLTLAKTPDAAYDLIILDAFSSDAIPMHLLTREALALYLSKLKPSGTLIFHISNKFLDLRPVLGNLAANAGIYTLYRDYLSDKEDEKAMRFRTQWAAMSRDPSALAPLLVMEPGWQKLPTNPNIGLWTDDFSNILGVLVARGSG